MLVFFLLFCSGAYALESTMTTSSNGGSASHSLEMNSGSSGSYALTANYGVTNSGYHINGPYSFADSVTNAEGDTAGISFAVSGASAEGIQGVGGVLRIFP